MRQNTTARAALKAQPEQRANDGSGRVARIRSIQPTKGNTRQRGWPSFSSETPAFFAFHLTARGLLRRGWMNRALKHAAIVAAVVGFTGVAAGGCLDRPVVYRAPSLNTTFVTSIDNQQIDQVDILVVIDNSASMGDKQQYLAQAVPDLITRLVTPNCVDPTSGTVYGRSDPQGNGTCAQGKVEFPPVHDMHVGVMSTSLGSRLSQQYQCQGPNPIQCDPTSTVTVNGVTFSNHNDDQGRLLNRSGPTETPLANAGTSFYLNWFPNNAKNVGKVPSPGAPAITDANQFIQDFTGLIQGVGNYGCGIESQLESWYRFLVQPDPYASLTLDSSNPPRAQWNDVDTTILQQRHDFLRPNSLVAIIDLTDENDSEIDVRSIGGQGYRWMGCGYDPSRGTSGCDENATMSGLVDPSTCTYCGFQGVNQSDPNCAMGVYSSENDWGYNSNLRHVRMMQKYGVSPQYPIERYVLGLTSTKVPDRSGEYPSGASSYQGLTNTNCTNPLFAASLPDGSSKDPATLCNLPHGTRAPDLIYYAHIGGVPHQLLQQDPTNPDSPQKETLADADWMKILGNDPENEDYTGIDPHMIESYQPRAGITTPPASSLDPINGYDWITDQGSKHVLAVDREFACTFPLTTPRDCSNPSDPSVLYACDCPATTGLTPQQLPPICNPTKPSQQVGAKTYPTQRELLLAKLVKSQGIVSSLCPIHVKPAQGLTETSDPVYGYNPAVNVIVDRIKTRLAGACVPEKIVPYIGDAGVSGSAPCLVLVSLPVPTNAPGETCANPGAACNVPGLFGPGFVPPGYTSSPLPQDVLDRFCSTREAAYTNAGGTPGAPADPNLRPVCAMTQLILDPNDTTECKNSSTPGWCYVQAQSAQQAAQIGCPYTLEFSPTMPPSGATTSLQCLETSVSLTGDATTP
jgi:hypothetical protein